MPESDTPAERLTEEVLADARRKARRRRRQAEREAEKTAADIRSRAEADAKRILEEARQRARREADLILATVDQEIHRERLIRQAAILEELIQAGFERAADRSLTDPRRTLLDLAVGAIRQMDASSFVVQAAEEDRALLDEDFLREVKRRLSEAGKEPPELAVAAEPAPIAGGLIVRATDGTQMVDNSLEARRRRLAPQLRQLLAGMIFPAPGGETPRHDETEAQEHPDRDDEH